MKKLSNKGFSLVELIIVIAIMAILSAALAPQLMKYIEQSRVSTDKQTCSSIEACVNTALTNDKVWIDVSNNWSSSRNLYFFVKLDEASGKLFFKGIAKNGNFRKELEPMLTSLKNPKQTGRNSYKVYITLKIVDEIGPDGNPTGGKLRSVKGVQVTTDAYDYNDDNQKIVTTDPSSPD